MKIGSYVAVFLTGMIKMYIAEITKIDPLRLKVEEDGPFANLKDGDYVILKDATERLQETTVANFVSSRRQKGLEIFSGLKSVGVEDGKLRELGT